MRFLLQLIAHHEALLLFVVILVGLFLAQLRMGGVKLGLAGVLFACLGFAFSTLDKGCRCRLPPKSRSWGSSCLCMRWDSPAAVGFFLLFAPGACASIWHCSASWSRRRGC